VIQAALLDHQQPIKNAEIYLESLDNEHCAQLATDKKQAVKPKVIKELRKCVHNIGSTHADEQGHYQFAEIKAGWYLIHFLCNISIRPTHPTGDIEGGVGCLLRRAEGFDGTMRHMRHNGAGPPLLFFRQCGFGAEV
jgi:hypothetical protein